MNKLQKNFTIFTLLLLGFSVYSQDIHISTSVTYNTNQNVSGNIFIHANGTLTITANVFMNQDKSVFIEKGGKLRIMNQGKIDELVPDQFWNGIVVLTGGTLVMDHAFVFNAKIGVYSEYSDALNLQPVNQLTINNSLFKYCTYGVVIKNNKNIIHSFSHNKIEEGWVGIQCINTQSSFYMLENDIKCSNYGAIFINSGVGFERGTVSADVPFYFYKGHNSFVVYATIEYQTTGIYCSNSDNYIFAENSIVNSGDLLLNQIYMIGINLVNSSGQCTLNTLIKSAHLGILIYGGRHHIIAQNKIEIHGEQQVDNGGILNINSYSHIIFNEIEVYNGTFGIMSEGKGSKNSHINDNIINIETWDDVKLAGIKSMANLGEWIDDNLIYANNSASGIYALNSLDILYKCNIINNALIGLNIDVNSEDALIRGNEFNSNNYDLSVRSEIGVQDRHGNLFSEPFSRVRAYGLDQEELNNSSFIANPSIQRHWPDDIEPANGWFTSTSSTGYYNCGNQGTEPPGFFADSLALCDHYETIKALKTTNPALYFVKIYHLLLLEYFKENYTLPDCIDKAELYVELCGIYELTEQVYALSQIKKPLLPGDPLYLQSEQMKTLQAEYLSTLDPIAKLSKMVQIQDLSASMWPGMTQKFIADSLSLEVIKTNLQNIICQEYLVDVWKNTLISYIDFLNVGEVNSSQMNMLESYSQLCADEYGDMIFLARSLVASYNHTYFVEFDGCLDSLEQRSIMKSSPGLEASIQPNPNRGNFSVKLNKKTSGVYYIHDIQGRIIQQSMFLNSDEIDIEINNSTGMTRITIETEEGEKTMLKSLILKQ